MDDSRKGGKGVRRSGPSSPPCVSDVSFGLACPGCDWFTGGFGYTSPSEDMHREFHRGRRGVFFFLRRRRRQRRWELVMLGGIRINTVGRVTLFFLITWPTVLVCRAGPDRMISVFDKHVIVFVVKYDDFGSQHGLMF